MPRDTAADQELARLKQMTSRAESAVKSTQWRSAMRRRASRISAIVRSIPALLLTDTFAVSKASGTWTVTVEGEPAIVISTRTSARSLEEVNAPIPVRVLRFELVDPELMLRLFAFEYITFVL